MKDFKLIDFWVSVGLIISYTIIFYLEPKISLNNSGYLIQGYFIVGGWQAVSMAVHIVHRNDVQLSQCRKIYTWTTLVCLITMPMGLLMLAILFYSAPFMAIFYTCLCGYEIFVKSKIKKYEKV